MSDNVFQIPTTANALHHFDELCRVFRLRVHDMRQMLRCCIDDEQRSALENAIDTNQSLCDRLEGLRGQVAAVGAR